MVFLAVMMTIPLYADRKIDPAKAPVISHEVMEQMNKPLEPQPDKTIRVSNWIWIGVIVIVGTVFGTLAYNTKKPI